jgi:hypothetical protein
MTDNLLKNDFKPAPPSLFSLAAECVRLRLYAVGATNVGAHG